MAGNRLNLGSWLGFNEAIVNKTLDGADRLTFRFRIPSSGYVAINLGKRPEGSEGVRISRRAEMPSLFYRTDAEGRFVRAVPFELALDPGWHSGEIRIDGGSADLTIDGRKIAGGDVARLETRVVSFRGGLETAWVDDVEISGNGRALFSDSFANRSGIGRAVLLSLAMTVALTGIAWSAAGLSAGDRRVVASRLVSGLFTLALLLHLFDRFYWSHLYLYPRATARLEIDPRLVRIETTRKRWADLFAGGQTALENRVASILPHPARLKWRDVTLYTREEIRSDAPEVMMKLLHERPSQRVLFAGTSQMKGAGADAFRESIAARALEYLGESLPIEIVNFSVGGARLDRILELFDEHQVFETVRPIYTVVNCSCASSRLGTSPADYRRELEKMVGLARGSGSGIAFVLEATSHEKGNECVLNAVKREVARELDVRIVDLHSHLNAPGIADSGFIWWDFVHLTTYGQRLAGQLIAREIAGDLRKILGVNGPSAEIP